MTSELTKWVREELKKRHWSVRELARQAGLSHPTISQTLNERITASNNFCLSIAKAFGEPPEKIFRLAGILPDLPDSTLADEIAELAKTLDEAEQRTVIKFIRFLKDNE